MDRVDDKYRVNIKMSTISNDFRTICQEQVWLFLEHRFVDRIFFDRSRYFGFEYFCEKYVI